MSKKNAPEPASGAPAAAEPTNSKIWGIASIVVALGSASVARKGLDASWKALTGKTPPANPADPDVALREAVAWAVFSGAAVALVKMAASRKAATYFVKSTGNLPGQLRADGNVAKKKA